MAHLSRHRLAADTIMLQRRGRPESEKLEAEPAKRLPKIVSIRAEPFGLASQWGRAGDEMAPRCAFISWLSGS